MRPLAPPCANGGGSCAGASWSEGIAIVLLEGTAWNEGCDTRSAGGGAYAATWGRDGGGAPGAAGPGWRAEVGGAPRAATSAPRKTDTSVRGTHCVPPAAQTL